MSYCQASSMTERVQPLSALPFIVDGHSLKSMAGINRAAEVYTELRATCLSVGLWLLAKLVSLDTVRVLSWRPGCV